MSDCALAIRNAISNVPSSYLPPQTIKQSNHCIPNHNAFIIGSTGRHCYLSFKVDNINPAFADYVRTQWVVNLKHWPSFYYTTAYQGINTNNYTEAWHQVLKSQFIPSPEKRRIDEFLQILIDEVEPSYRTSYDRVDGGFEEQTLNLFQLVSKRLADGYTKQSLATLGGFTIRFCEKSF
ncbi:hypothetical protein PCANC_24327 [Puccinia coronata f. sp. avenae]|uniref:Uncharacterized protein n=1 Tax=Puccinia coronata f. sp. avenae TaxID=200324 RepID=A0A2N5S6L6_9BASI|nr:hypothetical protein PCANC_24327 [Puccinia coronata f. sp. avenae]